LRDVIAEGFKGVGRRFAKVLSQSPVPSPQSPQAEDFWAIKDVSFEIKQGDRIGIIGRNGAGKPTLLKILSRITVPITGRARIKGRMVSLLDAGNIVFPNNTIVWYRHTVWMS
jgi:lipopolysaccharide transport system ATP-binding protein